MYRKVIAPAVALGFLALLAWLAYSVLRPFLVPIGWGATITVVTFPLFVRLRRRLGGRAGWASALMVLGIVVALVVPTLGLMVSLSHQAVDIYPKIEELVSRGNPLQALKEKLDSFQDRPVLGRVTAWARSLLRSAEDVGTALPGAMKKGIEIVTGMLTAALSNLLTFLFHLFLTLAALGVFYLQGEFLVGKAASLLPFPEDRGRELLNRLGAVTKGVVRGTLLTCIVQGALGGLGWWVVGLPSPLLFGTLMAFGSLVPVVGTMIVWLPGALFLLFTGETAAGIGLLLWGALAVGNIDNVLRPLLSGGDSGIPMPLMVVGILGGLVAFGLSGLILGPLVLATLLFVLEEHHRAVSGEEAPSP